ncbi:MAG: nucleotidyltransferase family protein [Candidatus Thermoplasmatota archaeon]|jgi:NDP-sugar pyrophosphorylase family protein|nr:nucleotidyltransferase family protein [Candidatus Thermoplasmatota archaeon]MCL5794053.1 nucleotidyltransferase family protein [Candidatus Thermoplasmatota archaeon]
MIGAILAGGYGKRMKPLTDKVPKALIEIKKGLTILDRQLLDFSRCGIKKVFILSSYMGEEIEKKYGSSSYGLELHYLKEEKPMGKLFSLRNVVERANGEDIVLRNGDTISDIDMGEFIEFSQISKYDIVIYSTKMRSPYGIVNISGDTVTDFVEKPILDIYMNAGIYYIKATAFEFVNMEHRGNEIESTIFPMLAAEGRVGAYKDDAYWIGIDSEKDLEDARKHYQGREDQEYGSVVQVYRGSSIEIASYLIFKGKSIVFPGGELVMRLVSGEATISGRGGSILPGEVVIIPKGGTLRALTRTTVEVTRAL